MLEVGAYLADAWILSTYWILAQRGRAQPYHYANALGGALLLAFEISLKAWPVAALTAVYIIIATKGIKSCTS